VIEIMVIVEIPRIKKLKIAEKAKTRSSNLT